MMRSARLEFLAPAEALFRRATMPKKFVSNRIERKIRSTLAAIFALLIIPIVALALNFGRGQWPGWLLEYRDVVIALLAVAVIFMALFSPLILLAGVDPRPLSGPGDDG